MAMSGQDLIWPTAPTFQPIITDVHTKRSKSTHSLASLSSRKPSRNFKSTPTSPVVPHRQIYDVPKSPTSTLSSSKRSKTSTPNGSAINLNAAYPSARDFMLSLAPREGGYAVAAAFGGNTYPAQTQSGRSERSSIEGRTHEFGGVLLQQKATARMSMDAALFDYNAHGYRQPAPRAGAPLQSTHSSTSDSTSTSASYVDESQGSKSSMSSPAIQPPVTEILVPVNARPSPLSQAVHVSDSFSSDTSSALDIGPTDAADVPRGNMPLRQDSAILKSTPSQSSPLAGPPLADTEIVAAIAAVAASNKSKKVLDKEKREQSVAMARKKVEDEKEKKRQEKVRKEEAKREEKMDKEVAKLKKKAAKQAAEDRIKALRNAPKPLSASPPPINARPPPVSGEITSSGGSPDSPSAESSGSTVRGTPAEGSQSSEPPQPALGRRVSLVAMLGRKTDDGKPSRSPVSRPHHMPNPPPPPPAAIVRGGSPAPSSVKSTLSKRKSSVWGALRKKLTVSKDPPPPIPLHANAFVLPTVIRPQTTPPPPPANHFITESASEPTARRSSVVDLGPAVAATVLPVEPAKDAYAALLPRDSRDGAGLSSPISESTFNLARMTSLPPSEAALSTTSDHVSRERSRDSRDRQSLHDVARPPMARQTTDTSVRTMQGGSSGHLSRPPSNVQKTLPSLPADGQSL